MWVAMLVFVESAVPCAADEESGSKGWATESTTFITGGHVIDGGQTKTMSPVAASLLTPMKCFVSRPDQGMQ